MSGIQASREIKRIAPNTGIVVVTIRRDESAVFRALEAGVSAYLFKSASAADILRAVRVVADGKCVYEAAVAEMMRAYLPPGAGVAVKDSVSSDTPSASRLTPREWEVLEKVADGLSNREIAVTLGVAVSKHGQDAR